MIDGFISSTRLRWDLEHDLTTLLRLELAFLVLGLALIHLLMALEREVSVRHTQTRKILGLGGRKEANQSKPEERMAKVKYR